MPRNMLGIVALIFILVVKAAEDPVERAAVTRDQADFLIDLLARGDRFIPARKGREQFIIIVEVEQQVGIVRFRMRPDRKSVVSGKRVSVRVDHGGRRFIKKQKLQKKKY